MPAKINRQMQLITEMLALLKHIDQFGTALLVLEIKQTIVKAEQLIIGESNGTRD